MNIPIEFISGHPSESWIVGDKGEIVGFITIGHVVQAIIVLEINGQFVTSLLHQFKRV
jgi:hypothetical protein